MNLSPRSVSVILAPGTAKPMATAQGARCHRVAPAAKATFNGVSLKRFTGIYAMGDLAYDRDCLVEFGFPGEVLHETRVGAAGGSMAMPEGMELPGSIPDAARSSQSATVRIEDGATSWTFTVPDAFTPRTLTVLEPGDGKLRRGEKATLVWSPATDILTNKGIGLSLELPGTPPEQGVIENDQLVVEGNRLTFTVPSNLPTGAERPVKLTFLGTALVGHAAGPCPVKNCGVSLAYELEPVTTTLAP